MMSENQDSAFDDAIQGGATVPPVVRPGQIDPRSFHYGYSAGERELKPRATDVGFASIKPGFLTPLQPFRINVPNDTMESLADKNAPASRQIEVLPRDSADSLMSRYQHRGFRILFPLTGMDGQAGMQRASKLFTVVHPQLTCERTPKILQRTCVHCRLADLESEASLDRIEKAKLSERQDISYGLGDDGSLRFISEVEAATIIHSLMLSAHQELHTFMVETLQQSKADVDAGRLGPGKKKFDKRDDWYFLNTHTVANDIAALASATSNVGQIVGETVRALSQGSQPDITAILAEQEKRHVEALAEQEKRFKKMFEDALKKTKAA
jgi:hypothetical protein